MMIYLDTSAALGQLLTESHRPPAWIWEQTLFSSRLLEYETFITLGSRGLLKSHGEGARILLERVSLVELTPDVLARALEPFPIPLRTLDALHLATAEFLRGRGHELKVMTFDQRLGHAAKAVGFSLAT